MLRILEFPACVAWVSPFAQSAECPFTPDRNCTMVRCYLSAGVARSEWSSRLRPSAAAPCVVAPSGLTMHCRRPDQVSGGDPLCAREGIRAWVAGLASNEAVRANKAGAADWRRAGRWVSSGYFWIFGGTGALLPFTALYYRDLGFSGWQVGVLASLPALGVALSGPIWGAYSDSRSKHRFVLRVALGGAALV